MTEATRLEILRSSPEIKRLLERDYEFSPIQASNQSELFRLSQNQSFELIGKDKSGGEFALCKGEASERPLLYASSEGQAGIVGRNLAEGLATIIDIPFWQDCLKFSSDGNLQEMRKAFALSMEDGQDRMGLLKSDAATVRARLALPVLVDPVLSLHSAVSQLSPRFPAYAADGWAFASLFNKFSVTSNPVWRRRLSSS
jgi:hypothetical protein